MGMYATGVFPSLHLNETSNEMNERIKRLVVVNYRSYDYGGIVF